MSGVIFNQTDNSGILNTKHDQIPVIARNEGLVNKYISATTADINADFLTVYNPAGQGVVLSDVNLTVDITAAAGSHGLDTGSEAAIFYHLYVIYNGTTVNGLISAHRDTPTMPAGFTYKKYVGAVINASSNFQYFHQMGNKVIIAEVNVGSSTSTSYANKTLATTCPVTARNISGKLYAARNADASSGYAFVAGTAAGQGEQNIRWLVNGGTNPGNNKNIIAPFADQLLVEDQKIYLKVNASGSTATLYVSGYSFHGIV
jgi:hypothetical protein